jgi:hypothetical protein
VNLTKLFGHGASAAGSKIFPRIHANEHLLAAWVWHLMGTMLKISVVQMKNETMTSY